MIRIRILESSRSSSLKRVILPSLPVGNITGISTELNCRDLLGLGGGEFPPIFVAAAVCAVADQVRRVAKGNAMPEYL